MNFKDTEVYFAFGSNTSEQLIQRVATTEDNQPIQGKVKSLGKGTLCGYKLIFNKWSNTRKCFVANIVKTHSPDDKVHGYMYQLNKNQIKRLHQFERVDENGQQSSSQSGYGYIKTKLIANSYRNDKHEVFVYQSPCCDETRHTVVDYINNILQAFIGYDYPKKARITLLEQPVINHIKHNHSQDSKENYHTVPTIEYINHPAPNIKELFQNHYSESEISTIINALKRRDFLLAKLTRN